MSGAAVLDVERNLVVGIVSETWFPDRSGKDRETAWAVDAGVLALDPFNLSVLAEPLPLREAPRPRAPAEAAQSAVAAPGLALYNAPSPLKTWVGRDDLLNALNAAWSDSQRRCFALLASAVRARAAWPAAGSIVSWKARHSPASLAFSGGGLASRAVWRRSLKRR